MAQRLITASGLIAGALIGLFAPWTYECQPTALHGAPVPPWPGYSYAWVFSPPTCGTGASQLNLHLDYARLGVEWVALLLVCWALSVIFHRYPR